MEDENESQENFPYTLLSTMTSNLEEERDEPASVSHYGKREKLIIGLLTLSS